MLPEEVATLVGRTGETVMLEVEKGAIKKYADAVGDQNTFHWEEEHARGSRYGTIGAPPGFFGWPTQWKGSMPFFSELRQEVTDTLARAGYGWNLGGGTDFEFFHPVRAGDVLVAVPKVINVTEREGKSGKMMLSVIETTYTNQSGDVVATKRDTLIHRKFTVRRQNG